MALAEEGVDKYLALLNTPTVTSTLITLTLSRAVANEAYDIFLMPFSLQSAVRVYAGVPNQTTFVLTAGGSGGIFFAGLARDSDGDGLSDGFEALVSHTQLHSQSGKGDAYDDWDGDGILNIEEFRRGLPGLPVIYQPGRLAVVP